MAKKDKAVTVPTLPMGMDDIFSMDGTPEENFSVMTTAIVEINFQAGRSIIEGRWVIGRLVDIFDTDADQGKKKFGKYEFDDITKHVRMNKETLNRCKKLYQTWSCEELTELMKQGISTSHFENLLGLATPEERRSAVGKLLLEDGKVIPVNKMHDVLPTSKESKAKAGISDGRGRPAKKDKDPEPEPAEDPDDLSNPLVFFKSVGERAIELNTLLKQCANVMKGARKNCSEPELDKVIKALNNTANKVADLMDTINKVFKKTED